jgi:hypothetical protein
MTRNTILVLILAALAVVGVAYYFNQPRTVEERMDAAGTELGDGNFGQAIQEMGNETEGERIQNNIDEAITTPAEAQ